MSDINKLKQEADANWAITRLLVIAPGLYAWQLHTFWIGVAVLVSTFIASTAIGWVIVFRSDADKVGIAHKITCILVFFAVALSGGQFNF